jgi:hypothetical protein
VYQNGQTNIVFPTDSLLLLSQDVRVPPAIELSFDPSVPLPFDSFSLKPPTVTSVSTPTVKQGADFTINGEGLYPSLVTGVLIGGQALPSANYQVVSDTKITVVAPNSAGMDEPVVVQTSQGVSNSNVTITVRPS